MAMTSIPKGRFNKVVFFAMVAVFSCETQTLSGDAIEPLTALAFGISLTLAALASSTFAQSFTLRGPG
jgi:hypothetical protein